MDVQIFTKVVNLKKEGAEEFDDCGMSLFHRASLVRCGAGLADQLVGFRQLVINFVHAQKPPAHT